MEPLQEIPILKIDAVKNLHVCNICKKICSRKDNLIQHMLIHSGEKSLNCDVCEIPFARKSDLKRHKLTHSKLPTQHKCDQCNEVFHRKKDLFFHRKTHKPFKQYNCTHCDEIFLWKTDLSQHEKIHMLKPLKQYNCTQCEEIFSRKIDLSKHEKIHMLKPLKQYNCTQCKEFFSRKTDLSKHEKIHKLKPIKQYNCTQCDEIFSKKTDLFKHEKIHKPSKQYSCGMCDKVFSARAAWSHHVRTSHPFKPAQRDPTLKDKLFEKVKHFQRQNALNIFTTTTIIPTDENDKDFHVFFDSVRSDVLNEFNYQLEEKRNFKWYAVTTVKLVRLTVDGDLEFITPHFRNKVVLQLTEMNLTLNIDDAFSKMINSFENFTQRGSGWVLDKILKLELNSAKYKPLTLNS